MNTPITLATLPQATAQEVFNQVVTHLRKQGERSRKFSKEGNEMCLYRSPDGLKCAAGCLISDTEYNPDMEGNTWLNLFQRKKVTLDHLTIIMDLQSIHDEILPNYWEEHFTTLAANYNLILPEKTS